MFKKIKDWLTALGIMLAIAAMSLIIIMSILAKMGFRFVIGG